jgi:hypothetical protein
MSFFALVLVIVVNMLPAGMDRFTMGLSSERNAVQLTKQADGGWRMKDIGATKGVVFYVTGTKITIKGKSKEESGTKDVGDMLGVDTKTDWTRVTDLTLLGKTPLHVDRKPDGLDILVTLSGDDTGQDTMRTFTVRWEKE